MYGAEFSEKTTSVLRTFVNKVCEIPIGNKYFPGGLPVSISNDLLRRVTGFDSKKHLEYVLSYKADGQRQYLGFLCVEGEYITFLQDRKGEFKRIDIQLYPDVYDGTLFDVELLCDRTLLIFDCACLHGNVHIREFYPHRLELAKMCLSKILEADIHCTSEVTRKRVRCEYASNFPDVTLTISSWKLKVKAIFYADAILELPDTWIYKNDGFIWTLASAPFFIFSGHKLDVLKWKPPDRITVDFYIAASSSFKRSSFPKLPGELNYRYRTEIGSHRMLTHHEGRDVWFSSMNTTKVEHGVYECSWKKDGGWSIESPRPDKTKANSFLTVIGTIVNIEESITKADIQRCFKGIQD